MAKLTTTQPTLSLTLAELERLIPIAKQLSPNADKVWLIRYDKDNTAVESLFIDNQFNPIKQIISQRKPVEATRQRKKTKVCDIGILYKKPCKNGTQNQFSAVLRFIVHYGFIMTKQ